MWSKANNASRHHRNERAGKVRGAGSPPSTLTAYTVSNEAQLNGAFEALRFSAADLIYTITLAAGLPGGVLALDTAMAPVVVPSGATLFIIGGGQTIDGGGSQAGLSVTSGSVAIQDLTIANAVRGGGGSGVGSALIVGSAAAVTLSNVVLTGDAGAGGEVFVAPGGAFDAQTGVLGEGTGAAGSAIFIAGDQQIVLGPAAG